MKVKRLGEGLLFTTAFLTCRTPTTSWTGTGFVYEVNAENRSTGETGPARLLVTNRHILQGVTKLKLQMLERHQSKEEPVIGARWEATVDPFSEEMWTGHTDPDIDVAVTSLTRIIEANRGKSPTEPFIKTTSLAVAMEEKDELELDAMEEVVFVGYPDGIYDQVNLLPVARRGTTASHPAVDYEGLPAFLIDASVFHGSSGSPVFLAFMGTYMGENGALNIGNRLMLLGVVASAHMSEASGRLETVRNIAQVPKTEIPLNLGLVFKASAIEQVVIDHLDKQGLDRLLDGDLVPTSWGYRPPPDPAT